MLKDLLDKYNKGEYARSRLQDELMTLLNYEEFEIIQNDGDSDLRLHFNLGCIGENILSKLHSVFVITYIDVDGTNLNIDLRFIQ